MAVGEDTLRQVCGAGAHLAAAPVLALAGVKMQCTEVLVLVKLVVVLVVVLAKVVHTLRWPV